MPRQHSLFVLLVSFLLCFFDVAVAAPQEYYYPSSASASISTGPVSSGVSQAASGSVSASSSRPQSSGTASASSGSKSSGRPASSRPSPSGTASQSQSLDSNGCPPHTATTTRTKSTYVYGATTTTTFTFPTSTVYSYNATSYYYSVSTEVIREYNTTTTYTDAAQLTVYETLPASTTVTVPTPPGFTPVRCLAAYFDPTVTITTETLTNTYYAYSYGTTSTQAVPTYELSYTSTSTSYDTISTVYETATSTSTITRSSATATEYAACASNNIAFEGPFDTFLSIPSGRSGYDNLQSVPASDPTDCCAACQANPSCVAGSGVQQSGSDSIACLLWFKTATANATCDPTLKGVTITTDETEILPIFISNAACGQYEFN